MNPNAINAWKPSPSLGNRIEQAVFAARLPQSGRSYLDTCIQKGPSRDVKGHRGNNTFTYFSQKTQATLKLESRRGEQAKAVLLDNDPKVVAFFAQPPQVELDIKRPDGTSAMTVRYTPDFLIVYQDRVVVAETKDSTELLERSLKNEYQYFRDLSGVWHYRAAEEYFAERGIAYELISTADLPPRLVGNWLGAARSSTIAATCRRHRTRAFQPSSARLSKPSRTPSGACRTSGRAPTRRAWRLCGWN